MTVAWLAMIWTIASCAGQPLQTIPVEVRDLVDVTTLDRTLKVDMAYARADNFAKKKVYPSNTCFLRKPVAEKLIEAQKKLQVLGYGLKLWDCFRPFSIQKEFWALVPDEKYVAKPVEKDGLPVEGSKHNRGAAIDVTLVDLGGYDLEMPSRHDDFSKKAHRSCQSCSHVARRNLQILSEALIAAGFTPMETEWWHYDGPRWEEYPIANF